MASEVDEAFDPTLDEVKDGLFGWEWEPFDGPMSKQYGSVTCSCGFRFGAEHPQGDKADRYVCPNCEEVRLERERDAALDVVRELVAALEEARDYLPVRRGAMTERDRAQAALTRATALLDPARPARATAEKG